MLSPYARKASLNCQPSHAVIGANRLRQTYTAAAVVLSSLRRLTVSTPNVDMVVKPPNSPVPSSSNVSVCSEAAIRAPRRNAPERFTAIVAHGTSPVPEGIASATPQRAIEPIAPPRPTSAAGCMVLAGTDGASYF